METLLLRFCWLLKPKNYNFLFRNTHQLRITSPSTSSSSRPAKHSYTTQAGSTSTNKSSTSIPKTATSGGVPCPFWITRSQGGELPVYTDYRKARTQTWTVICKVTGDTKVLKEELEKLTGSEVVEKVGSLKVRGLHVNRVKEWLQSIGF